MWWMTKDDDLTLLDLFGKDFGKSRGARRETFQFRTMKILDGMYLGCLRPEYEEKVKD